MYLLDLQPSKKIKRYKMSKDEDDDIDGNFRDKKICDILFSMIMLCLDRKLYKIIPSNQKQRYHIL